MSGETTIMLRRGLWLDTRWEKVSQKVTRMFLLFSIPFFLRVEASCLKFCDFIAPAESSVLITVEAALRTYGDAATAVINQELQQMLDKKVENK
jgi:hypothetical protein